jgi:hypothetical protein
MSKTKTKSFDYSPVESPIFVEEKSSCEQMDSLEVPKVLRPRQKVFNMDIDFLLYLTKLMNERERGRYVPYERSLSLQSPGYASILSPLIGPEKQTKVQNTSYSTKISSNIDPSTVDKLIWNKYKFERNRKNIDCINKNKMLLTTIDVSATDSSSSPCPNPFLKSPHTEC